MINRRDPDGDPPLDAPRDDLAELVRVIVSASRPHDDSVKQLRAVIVGVGTTLLAAFVVGAWILSNQFYSLQAEFHEWKAFAEARLTRLENRP